MEYKYVHHIAVRVKSREEGIATYTDKLGFPTPGPLPGAGGQGAYLARFFMEYGCYLELMAPTGPETTVARAIARWGEGFHSISLAVGSLPESIKELRAKGVQLLNTEGDRGGAFDDAFIHPRSAHRVLIQLEERPDRVARDFRARIRNIDHVVIAVKDLNEGIATYRDTLGMTLERTDENKARKQAIFTIGGEGCFLEMLEPLDPETPVGRALERRGEGIYMVALAVNNLGQTVHDLKAKGVQLIGGERPQDQVFSHPHSAHGALLRLVERP